MLGMVEGKEYEDTNTNLIYKISKGSLQFNVSDDGGRWINSGLSVNDLLHCKFEEIPQPPKEYTLEELVSLYRGTQIIKNITIKSESGRRMNISVNSGHVFYQPNMDYSKIPFSDFLGKWTIVEGE